MQNQQILIAKKMRKSIHWTRQLKDEESKRLPHFEEGLIEQIYTGYLTKKSTVYFSTETDQQLKRKTVKCFPNFISLSEMSLLKTI